MTRATLPTTTAPWSGPSRACVSPHGLHRGRAFRVLGRGLAGSVTQTANCASVSDSLFESEFFGHRRGAFTGALADRAGWFELADNGTLLLDEVGDMPINQQAKLLRAIEENAVVPVGAASPVAVNVRVVAATNVDLREAVEQGRFRRDFLDRLEVLTLRLPPLRDRSEDFPLLVEHFFALANQEEGTEVRPPGRPDLTAMARRGLDAERRVSGCPAMSLRV